MYELRGYPIDHALRGAKRAQRNPRRFRLLHALAARFDRRSTDRRHLQEKPCRR